MTTFTRIDLPFAVKSSVGATSNDFTVSTDGTINFAGGVDFDGAVGVSGAVSVNGFTANTTATFKSDVSVSAGLDVGGAAVFAGTVDVSGALSATAVNAADVSVATTMGAGFIKAIVTVSATVSVPVTAAGFLTIYDLAGTPWRVPAYVTLAAVG